MITFFHLKLPICAYRVQIEPGRQLIKKKVINLHVFVESWIEICRLLCSLNKASDEKKRSKFSKDQKRSYITQ